MSFLFGRPGPACDETIYVAADHAGFALKQVLIAFLREELDCEVEDCGAAELVPGDDYPAYVQAAAAKVAEDPAKRRGIVIGGSGQGEAIAANRFKGVRAAVYYGEPQKEQTDADGESLGMIESSRRHNDANVLSLGARFISTEHAKDVVREWLETPFSGEERHVRRIKALDA